MLFMLFHDFLLVCYFSVVTQETFRRTPAGRPYRMVICDEALLVTNDQPLATQLVVQRELGSNLEMAAGSR